MTSVKQHTGLMQKAVDFLLNYSAGILSVVPLLFAICSFIQILSAHFVPNPSLGAETMDMTKALYRVIEFTL